jgi:type II secretory pathway component GspD/PulD (secretin)
MTNRPTFTLARSATLALAISLCAGTAASAQNDAPATKDAPRDARGRRVIEGPPTTLAFKDVTVSDVVPFIVEVTGKVVMPQQAIMSRKITVLNDRPLPREEALDLVVLALQQNGIAVVESAKIVTLRDIGETSRQDVPVIGPEESVLDRNDLGNIAEKVFPLRYNTAKAMGDVVKTALPDFAKMSIDEESNQLSVLGNIGLLQRIERLVGSLDRPAAGALQTETFSLRYSDAAAIKTNIDDLFGSGGTQRRQADNQNRGFRFPGQPAQEGGGASTSEIRVTANTQQNSVTVVADPVILSQIREQITKAVGPASRGRGHHPTLVRPQVLRSCQGRSPARGPLRQGHDNHSRRRWAEQPAGPARAATLFWPGRGSPRRSVQFPARGGRGPADRGRQEP